MTDIIKSKGWNWEMISDKGVSDQKNSKLGFGYLSEDIWKNPAPISYYLLSRWKKQGKHSFLDLGCGLGRHTILFGMSEFDVSAFDISENALERTAKWAKEKGLNINIKQGDMLNLPFDNESMDCILCLNVISHTDTRGMYKVADELKRVLKPNGECYLTLGSKETWGYKQNWPVVDANTKLRDEPGPEYMVPHFYADYDLIFQIFKNFDILDIQHIGTYYTVDGQKQESYHWHLLIRKR